MVFVVQFNTAQKAEGLAETYPRRQELRLAFPSTPFDVRAAVRTVVATLSPFGPSADLLGSIEIVLAEALNNISEHAYRGQPGQIELVMRRIDAGFHFLLVDDGTPMPAEGLPLAEFSLPETLSAMPEGGFGWMLIRSQTDGLQYHRRDGRNELSFVVPAGGRGQLS